MTGILKASGSPSIAALTSVSVMRSNARSSADSPVGSLTLREAPVEVEVFDLVEFRLLGPTTLRAIGVDEGVGQDLVEPSLEVRAFLESSVGAVGLQVGLLDEILSVGRVVREPHRRGVERRHELHRFVGKAGLVSHGMTLPRKSTARGDARLPAAFVLRYEEDEADHHHQHRCLDQEKVRLRDPGEMGIGVSGKQGTRERDVQDASGLTKRPA